MEILKLLYSELLHRPIVNALAIIYNIIPGHDFGLTIIILTIIIKIILYPIAKKGIRYQQIMLKIQPEIKAIEKKITNKEEQVKAMMAVYKKYKINPFFSILTAFIQIPILIALYRVIMQGVNIFNSNGLYGFVPRPEVFNPFLLNLVDLSKKHNIYLAVAIGVATFIQTKMMMNKKNTQPTNSDFASALNFQMTYFMPIVVGYFSYVFPSALALYWLTSTLFTIGQQYLTKKEDKTIN
jgi:YidC/Oxa1 family membrane protein insertase